MKTSSILFSVCSLLLIFSSFNAWAFRQVDSHSHGEAELNIAIEAQNVQIEFTSPAMNLAGFEHMAKTEAEKKQINAIIEYLKQAQWLQLKPQCTLQTSTAELHQEAGEEHSDFTAEYQFVCQPSQSIESINFAIFSDYPGLHEMDVNLITVDKQTNIELDHKNSLLKLSYPHEFYR